MRMSLSLLVVFTISCLFGTSSSMAQKDLARSPRILSAKTVYLDNQTGSFGVGSNALVRLKKWGKFQIVSDRQHADLVFLLSADSYNGGKIVMAGGQTGTIEDGGHIEEDPIPNYNKQTRPRYAYLTVIDATNGGKLWSDEHVWGGLLTGFNSVGDRMIRNLERQTKK